MRIGGGQVHNEAAWRARLPDAYRYLLDIRDDPNTIAQRASPPVITSTTPNGVITFPTQDQFQYRLQQAASLTGAWTSVATHPVEDKPWDQGTVTNPPSGDVTLYRILAEAVP